MRLILIGALLVAGLAAHAATVTSVTVTATSTSLVVGQTATLACTATYSNGSSSACVSPSYSENQSGSVILLSGTQITGYAFGSAVVTATTAGVSGSLSIKVVPVSQENLGAIPAAQVVQGVGFNVTPGNDWEFSMAAAAGARHVRIQCGWATAENQTPPPQNTYANPRYTLQSYCVSALASAKKYGLHPTIIAAYGPPYHAILSLSVPGGAPSGATSLNVQFASGVGGDTLASMTPFKDTLIGANGAYLTAIHSYAGGLITAINQTDATHATLTLASALTTALPANTSTLYTINEGLYAPPASFSPTDPSIAAYASYVQFLAQSIAAAGLTGEVEIWNEPPWSDDPWDNRSDFYDISPGPVAPGPQGQFIPNWGFAAALQKTTPPAGVTYIWGGTEKSGTNSVLSPQMLTNTGVAFAEPASAITSESFHPYGNNPEGALWSAPCLAALPSLNNLFICNFLGVSGGNFSLAAQQSLLAQKINPAWGVAHNITETGFGLSEGDPLHQARFIMRQLLGYQAAGVTPIEFYRLYDTSPDQLGFVNTTTLAPLPAYTAVAGLMADLAKIQNAPVTAYSATTLTSIVSYSGTFPLDSVHLVGARSGDTANSELLAVWQRSYVPTGGTWATMSQPPPAPVTVAIPAGLGVSAVVNLDTRQVVPYTTSGQQITFNVSDDPIEVLVQPPSSATTTTSASSSVVSIAIAPTAATVALTGTVPFACTASFSNGTTAPCPSPSYISSNPALVSLSGNLAIANAVGSAQIIATVAGAPPAMAAVTVRPSVSASSPSSTLASLTLGGLSHVYSGAPQPALVTTIPAGLSYAITYAGSATVPVAAGSYPVVATLTNPSYTAAPVTGTLVIAPAVPTITWTPSASAVGHGLPVGAGVLDATSTIPGAFAYTAALSGGTPLAIISGTVLAPGSYTFTGQFTPADSTDFSSASKSISFTVEVGAVFVANRAGTVTSFFTDGSLQSPATGGGSVGAAVDATGNVWSINLDRTTLSEFDDQGQWLANFGGEGISAAAALAIDGTGTIWIANGTGSIACLTSAGAPAAPTSIASPALQAPASLSVDASGSLWIANSASNSVTEVVGVASPVLAPALAAVAAVTENQAAIH